MDTTWTKPEGLRLITSINYLKGSLKIFVVIFILSMKKSLRREKQGS